MITYLYWAVVIAAAFGLVFLFGAGNVLLWHVVLLAWERVGYAGSLEWLLAKLKRTGARAAALRGS